MIFSKSKNNKKAKDTLHFEQNDYSAQQAEYQQDLDNDETSQHSDESINDSKAVSYVDFSQPSNVQDLMRLIGEAIEVWAKQNNMSNVPKDIIFGQALAAMNGMYNIIKSNRKDM